MLPVTDSVFDSVVAPVTASVLEKYALPVTVVLEELALIITAELLPVMLSAVYDVLAFTVVLPVKVDTVLALKDVEVTLVVVALIFNTLPDTSVLLVGEIYTLFGVI